MEYTDFEGGHYRGSLFRSMKRKWHQVPRYLRFYFVITFIFILTMVTSYFYYFGDTNYKTRLPSIDTVDISSEKVVRNSDKSVEEPKNHFDIPRPYTEESDSLKKTVHSEPLTAQELREASYKQNDIQKRIQEAILHSWNGYRKYAWGFDTLKPLTKKGEMSFEMGLTILDTLDTLLVAGLEDEFAQGVDWVKNKLSFEINKNVNCFEVTIRALGGLLSAYHLSQDKILLEKANDLGDRLIHCFDSKYKVPYSDINLKTRVPVALSPNLDSSLSETSTMQIEFRDLTYETKNNLYEEKSFALSKHLHELAVKRNDPLMPMYISPITGSLTHSTITMGARGDSYYEYLYKQYLQCGVHFLFEDYVDAISNIQSRLVRTTKGELQLSYIGEITPSSNFNEVFPKMDHLVCFLSGTLALGYYHENKKQQSYRGAPVNVDNKVFADHLKTAEDLARTCHYMYNLTSTGLAPEIAYFGITKDEAELYIKPRDSFNIQRPEFVESLFYLYHITGNEIYRKWGLQVFEAFERHTRVASGGYTSIGDVKNIYNLKPRDKMESFWTSETLKYLYLLFLDDRKIVDKLLNKYVFNSEGHIIPRRVMLT